MDEQGKFAIVDVWSVSAHFHTLSGRPEFFNRYSLVSRRYGDSLGTLREPVALVLLHDDGETILDLGAATILVDHLAPPKMHTGTPLVAPIVVLTPKLTPHRVALYMQAGAYDVLATEDPTDNLAARAVQIADSFSSRAGELRELARVRRSRQLAEGIIEALVPIAVALTSETDMDRLVERVLHSAMELSGAEGGTLYLRSENNNLGFRLVRNRVLDIHMGGPDGDPIRFPPLALLDPETQQPNEHYVCCAAAAWGRIINIRDVYKEKRFDLEGSKRFDEANQYLTRSMLTVPLRTSSDRVFGVLQLINARDIETLEPTPFNEEHERWLEALSKIAAAALEACKRLETLQLKLNHMDLDIDRTQCDKQVRQIVENDRFKELKANAARMRQERLTKLAAQAAGVQ